MTRDWLDGARGALAAERILDAAGRVFLARGVHEADVADIAAEAGCSRATVYRYFENRHALKTAYMHREARRVAEQVVREAAAYDDPGAQLTETVLGALRIVRETPVLAAWFAPSGGAASAQLAAASQVIESLCAAFLGADDPGEDLPERARWLVRVILSLLTLPGRDEDDERAMLRRFVVPGLFAEDPADVVVGGTVAAADGR
ncbi:TetR/AcrR family transcriptional regulator [Yinghuangia seranimata]|uniref:TetR/AcrR family transcriptional regulator n=1 Tax=Yinghuangia seranimata TaxID=408067 RepID=UPI00248D2591|nr:TetR/AcrR family transcriptional regulator [Yinghuangia seranimata]MDI2130684.1 TetR/AcrR family transcriptional regulator [Yinghuangia seranimata]